MFSKLIGLLRMSQGGTKSVAWSMRIVVGVLVELVPAVCCPFINDFYIE